VIGFDENKVSSSATLVPVNPKPVGPSGSILNMNATAASTLGWVEPLTGKRDAYRTPHRRRLCPRLETCISRFPDAEVIVVVQDNLNTHSKAALYGAFEASEAPLS